MNTRLVERFLGGWLSGSPVARSLLRKTSREGARKAAQDDLIGWNGFRRAGCTGVGTKISEKLKTDPTLKYFPSLLPKPLFVPTDFSTFLSFDIGNRVYVLSLNEKSFFPLRSPLSNRDDSTRIYILDRFFVFFFFDRWSSMIFLSFWRIKKKTHTHNAACLKKKNNST